MTDLSRQLGNALNREVVATVNDVSGMLCIDFPGTNLGIRVPGQGFTLEQQIEQVLAMGVKA